MCSDASDEGISNLYLAELQTGKLAWKDQQRGETLIIEKDLLASKKLSLLQQLLVDMKKSQ